LDFDSEEWDFLRFLGALDFLEGDFVSFADPVHLFDFDLPFFDFFDNLGIPALPPALPRCIMFDAFGDSGSLLASLNFAALLMGSLFPVVIVGTKDGASEGASLGTSEG
jgi:hypothetical protein